VMMISKRDAGTRRRAGMDSAAHEVPIRQLGERPHGDWLISRRGSSVCRSLCGTPSMLLAIRTTTIQSWPTKTICQWTYVRRCTRVQRIRTRHAGRLLHCRSGRQDTLGHVHLSRQDRVRMGP
jgi:hypothetical protein